MIRFTLSGTNKNSYNNVNDITINVIAANMNVVPFVSQFDLHTYSGGVTFTAGCSEVGTLYFALSLNNGTLVNLNASDIQQQTLEQGLQQTDTDVNDMDLTKYGYQDMRTANQSV